MWFGIFLIENTATHPARWLRWWLHDQGLFLNLYTELKLWDEDVPKGEKKKKTFWQFISIKISVC